MSIRTTAREIMRNYPRTIRLGYCEAQFLFPEGDALLYTAGVYGCNAHVYIFPEMRCAVSTGYRPFGKIDPPHDLVHEYDERARRQMYELHDYNLRPLQMEFIERVINQY